MPDISMCKNEDCDRKNQCFRYTAIPSIYQAYCSFKSKNCKYFIRDENNERTCNSRNNVPSI